MTSCSWTYMRNVTSPGIFICRSLYTCVYFYFLFMSSLCVRIMLLLWSAETAIVTNDTWMLSGIESCSWIKSVRACSEICIGWLVLKLCWGFLCILVWYVASLSWRGMLRWQNYNGFWLVVRKFLYSWVFSVSYICTYLDDVYFTLFYKLYFKNGIQYVVDE